ncbi:MAG: lytic transglycosylase domain-containing protein [Firmicutes bacterium]|nr:lytic transglycosylase domain-containing protein [Bacillota bacterium]
MTSARPVWTALGSLALGLAGLLSLLCIVVAGRWLVLAPQGAAELLARRSLPSRPVRGIPFADEINRAARRHGLDPTLVAAVVAAESDFQPTAVSPKGARGLMQLGPLAWRETAPADCRPHACAFNPVANLEAGSRYLRRMLDRFGGDVRLALAAYNAGPETVAAYGGLPPYRETQGYVLRVGIAWWELRRTGTLPTLPRTLLRFLDSLPALVAASTILACAVAAVAVWRAARRP